MQIFTRKAIALECLNASSDELRLFMEDTNTTNAKRFIVARAEDIYKLIQNYMSRKLGSPSSKTQDVKYANLYEGWTTKQPMNFAVDMDVSNPDKRKNLDQTIIDVINIVMTMAVKCYKHTYTPNDIIILKTEPQEKKDSVHIIFKGLTFENYTACKHFYTMIKHEHPHIDEYGWDEAIYRPTCLRMAFCTKKGKTYPLLPYRVKINNISTLTPKNFESEMDYWLTSLITYTEPNCPFIKAPPKEKVSKQETPETQTEVTTTLEELQQMLDELPMVYCDEYENWIKVGMALHNEFLKTDNKEYFKLWNEWSKKSEKYTNSKDLKKTWDAFKPSSNPVTLASIRHWWNEEQDPERPKVRLGLQYIVDGYEPKPILLNHNNEYKSVTVNKAKLEPEDFMPYLKYKMLAVQSEKGTGKTYNLLRALFEHGHAPNKILFVSPRRTFGMKLKADLHTYGFRLYSEIKESQIDVARVICQLDSVHRIKTLEFDLIVIDECESLARYVTSSHFTKNPNSSLTLANLRYLLNTAKQTVVLDADLSERSMKFFGEMIFEKDNEQLSYETEPVTNEIYQSKKAKKARKKDFDYGGDSDDDILNFHNPQPTQTIIKPQDNTFLIINQYLLYQDYKVKYTDLRTWYSQMCSDLDKNRKLVIPMASREKAKDLYEYLITKYDDKQIKIINSETSDQDKLQQLMNINDEWTNFDVVIYTPSICMGVSFDVPNHFDRIYAYGCHNSLGAQEFAQMLHRVRNPKDKRIILTLDKFLPYCQQNDTVDYSQAEEMLCNDYYLTTYELNNNLIPKKYGKDRKIEYPEQYKKEPIYELYVRNTQEMLQDRLNFGASLFGYLRTKGYIVSKLNYGKEVNPTIMQEIKNIHTIRKTTEKQEMVQHIVNARDITHEEYEQKKKFKDEVMTEEDLYELKRYNFKRVYQITSERMDEQIVDTYADPEKMRWYSNTTSIIDHAEQTTADKLRIMQHNENYLAGKRESCFDAFTFNGHYSQHYYVITIFNTLGFDINQMETKVYNNDFMERLPPLIEWLDKEKMNLMMKYGLKTKPGSLTKMTPQQQLRFLNTITEYQYGIVIKKMNYYPKDRSKEYYKLTNKNVWDDLPHDGENNNPKLVPLKIPEYEGVMIDPDPFIED
jgi:hypothetical protein